MKFKIRILVTMIMLSLFGCYDESNNIKTQQQGITVENGRLTFQSIDQFSKTLEEIEAHKVNVEGGRLLNLDYASYFQSQINSSRIDKGVIYSVLDTYGLQILMNASNEFQIAGKIYRIDENFSKVYSQNGILLETYENMVESLNRNTNKFEKRKNQEARSLDEYAYYYLPLLPGNDRGYYIQDIFTRTTTGFLTKTYNYYYNAELDPQIPLQLMNAEYFSWDDLVCGCETPGGTVPRYTYNTRIVQTYLGKSKRSWSDSHGYHPDVFVSVKAPGYDLFYWNSYL